MDRAALLACYFAAQRFKPRLPLNRALGDRMMMITDLEALIVIAPGGAYTGPPIPVNGQVSLRFRIPGERPYYLVCRHDPDPARIYWHATDVLHLDMRESDYVAFPAHPADEPKALALLRGMLEASLKHAQELLTREPDDFERRDPQVAGIAAMTRREARTMIDEFEKNGWKLK